MRKAKKIYEPATAQSPTETTSYIYENGKLLRQITGSEVLTFVYGTEGVIGFTLSGSTEIANGNYLYRKNLFGDIIGIINESGELVYEYAYSAFGKSDKEEETGIGAKNPFRYRGYYYDEETGLYYLKSRYYDPETGRFITIDDISYLAPETINGLNLYAYCGNNPVMRVDENGNAWWDWLFKALAFIAVGVSLVAVTIFTGGAGAVIAGIAFGAALGGLVGGFVNEAQGGSFMAGWLGGVVSGAIQSSGAIFAPFLGTVGGGAIGSFAGSIVTQFTDRALGNNRLSNTEILEGALNSAIYSGIASIFTAGLGKMINSAIGDTIGGSVLNGVAGVPLTKGFAEILKGFFGAILDALSNYFSWRNPIDIF